MDKRDTIFANTTPMPLGAENVDIYESRSPIAIEPFHSVTPELALKDRRTWQQQSGIQHMYSRVRRRSPLCHDVLDFMLENGSMSSLESAAISTHTKENPAAPSCAIAQYEAKKNNFNDIVAIAAPPMPKELDKKDEKPTAQKRDNLAWPPKENAESDTSEETSDDGFGLDDVDDGFDGECVSGSAATTAECSRSTSYKSSQSSNVSEQTASVDVSVRWWKRPFIGSVEKQTKRPSKDKPRSLIRMAVSNNPSSNTAAPSDKVKRSNTLMARLRRSVSFKRPETNNITTASVKRSATMRGPLSPNSTRLFQPRNQTSNLLSNETGSCDSSSQGISPKLDMRTRLLPQSAKYFPCRNALESQQWILLQCKGASNLHITTVPTRVCSLTHKDAFLLYPCPFRSMAITSPLLKRSAATSIRSPGLDANQLMKQEYRRRRSIYSHISPTIYVWLGAHASTIKKEAIIRVATEIRDCEITNSGVTTVVTIDESTVTDAARHQFFAQLFSIQHSDRVPVPSDMSILYKQLMPLSKAGDDFNFERAMERRKVMYGFWEAIPPATILAVGADINAASLLKVPIGGVVVLDTWSDIFIWWRDEHCNPAVHKCASNFVKMLLQDACIPPRPISAAIWHEVHGLEHVIFKTKFTDWPFVFATSPALGSASKSPSQQKSSQNLHMSPPSQIAQNIAITA